MDNEQDRWRAFSQIELLVLRGGMMMLKAMPDSPAARAVEQMMSESVVALCDQGAVAADRESELQDDLERRDEQIGRAMTLLRRVWDESGEGTGVVCRQTGANHWSDVVRWVSEAVGE
jgi:hypothetical protein